MGRVAGILIFLAALARAPAGAAPPRAPMHVVIGAGTTTGAKTIYRVRVVSKGLFTLGVAHRARFTHRERETVEAELLEATLAAGHDPLTELLNRRGLDDWLTSSEPLGGTVLFVDLDGFKAVNDRGGHAAGDDTLRLVGRIVRHAVRAQDAVARIGRDEFVMVLSGCTDPTIVDEVVARISSAAGVLLPLGTDSSTRIGVSIGSAVFDARVPFSRALAEADADAYRIKAQHHAESRHGPRSQNFADAGA